jgi:hypothetical protein
MRGTLLGVLLASIPLSAIAAELPNVQANEAIALIESARLYRNEGYFYRAEAQYRSALAIAAWHIDHTWIRRENGGRNISGALLTAGRSTF